MWSRVANAGRRIGEAARSTQPPSLACFGARLRLVMSVKSLCICLSQFGSDPQSSKSDWVCCGSRGSRTTLQVPLSALIERPTLTGPRSSKAHQVARRSSSVRSCAFQRHIKMVTPSGHLEGLGETLIPAINRLQDIFSQVCTHRQLYTCVV